MRLQKYRFKKKKKKTKKSSEPWGRRERSWRALEAMSSRAVALRILLRLSWRRLTSISACSFTALICSTPSFSNSIATGVPPPPFPPLPPMERPFDEDDIFFSALIHLFSVSISDFLPRLLINIEKIILYFIYIW